MKRGIIVLEKEDYQALITHFGTFIPPNLKNKFFKNPKIKKPTTFQFSEEELETILDCLPTPFQIQNKELKNVRLKLQNFLLKLRFD